MTLVFSPHAEAAYRYSSQPPTISGSPPLEVIVGKTYEFAPVASDPEGRALVFSIFGLPQWARFDRYTGRLSGVPGVANVGTSSRIVIAVSDKRKMAYLPEFRITVRSATAAPATTNSAPQIAGVPSGTATAGLAYTFQPTASAANGDSLTFSISNQPAWATFNRGTGLLSGTPTTAGTYPAISISVSDGTVVTSLAAFSIVVSAPAQQNSAPTISGTPPTSVVAGTAFSFQPAASDPDGNALGFSIANKPAWATISATTGRLSGTPALADVGTFSGVTISVSDGKTSTTLATFSISVTQVATGSATLSWAAPSQNADGSALTNLTGYRIYFGTSSASLTQSVDIPNAGILTYVLGNLSPATWYFAVKAVAGGVESDLSNVASKTIT